MSLSLLGIHFGHYMATALDNDLSEIHALFLTIAVQTGYSLLWWQQSHCVARESTGSVVGGQTVGNPLTGGGFQLCQQEDGGS